MLRKLASAGVLAFAGLLAMAGTASAAPYDPATLSVNDIGAPGGDFQALGTGFGDDLADDYVILTVTYGAPSGLRSNSALSAAARAESYTVDVDDDGNFETVFYATQGGDVYVTAVGYPSGERVAGTLTLGGAVTTTTAGGSTAWVQGSGSGGSSGWSDSASSGGLANTGASIAGPIAIGIGVLVVGLGLLFFGTRGVIRRKGPRTTTG